MIIGILEAVGEFAENKDIARDIRVERIMPALEKGQSIILDFSGVSGATQSFVHALISELFRIYGPDILNSLRFKNCNEKVQKIIEIVSEYMQES